MRERLLAPEHLRSRSLGRIAVEWMHYFLIHGPGDIQGTPLSEIPLSDELVGHTLDIYALDEDGHRLYDSVFYSRPKGADKSGHAARIGCFEAIGPCRFAGWAEGGESYSYMDFEYIYSPGEPMGRAVTYPFLRCMATEEGQTGNVYDSIYYNFREGPLSEALKHRDDAGLTRIFLPDGAGAGIYPSTASSAAKDGGKETWCDFDETHLYALPELRRMYETVRRNMTKRRDAEPWSYETSTMYALGQNSVAEKSHELAMELRSHPERARRFLFDHRQASRDLNLEDDAAVLEGLREAYGDASSYMPLDRILSEFRDPRNDITDSVRYFLNQARTSTANAFSLESWSKLARRDYTVPAGALITLGFDGARRRDSTAIIGTEVATGYQWVVGHWARPEYAPDDWSIDEADVEAVLSEAFRTWSVWRMYADPPYWESSVAKWRGEYGEKVVIEWPTNRYRQMAFALRAYSNAMADGDVSHSGDPILADALANARRVDLNFRDDDDRPLWVVQKERTNSPLKIDAIVAGCLSWEARNDAVASGAKPAGPSKYEAGEIVFA